MVGEHDPRRPVPATKKKEADRANAGVGLAVRSK
jgi:hypothetical protein